MVNRMQKLLVALVMALTVACVAPAVAFADDQPLSAAAVAGEGQAEEQPEAQEPLDKKENPGVKQAGGSEVQDQQVVQGQNNPDSNGTDGTDDIKPAEVTDQQGSAETDDLKATDVATSDAGSSGNSSSDDESAFVMQTQSTGSGTPKAAPSVSYQAHVQNVGWQGTVSNGTVAGTSGKSLRMEAIKVTVNTGGYSGGLQMKAHVQNIGWQDIVGNGATLGTTGKSLRVEALRLALTGEVSQYYDIYYRAHVQNVGWQGWVSNGAIAGTTGRSLRIEALQIELRAKKTPAAVQGDGIVGVRYQAHVQNIGWQGQSADGATAGTTGQSLRVEAFRLWLDAGTLSGNIEYRAHVQNKGWLPWVKNGAVAGTSGQSLRMEAFEIRLTGAIADKYDVVYTAHVQNVGWQSSKNNEHVVGTTGQGLRMEALQVQLVSKSQRNGWFNDTGSWNYYSSGSKAKGRWVVTEESPIESSPGLQRYWIDTSGNLAVSRAINPSNAIDRGSYSAYATKAGYVSRNTIVELNKTYYWANNDGLLSKPDVSKMIENAVKWAINTANDDSHGYSQEVRWGPDYDCSSFVIQAFKSAGFLVGGAVYTGNMVSEMTKHGFVWSTDLSGLRRGDIVLVHNDSRQHTELYIGNSQLVGAHISETGGITGRAGDQTGREICVDDYYNAPWQGYLRAVLK